VPAGALMWAAVVYEAGASGYINEIVTDETTPTAFVLTDVEQQIPGPDVWLSLWKGVATETDTHAVTVNLTTSRVTRGLFIGAFTGNDAVGTIEDALAEYDAATNNPSLTVTTAVDGCLLVGVSINNNAVGATAGSGFSTAVMGGGPDYPIAFEWDEQNTANASTIIDFTALSGTPGFAIAGMAIRAPMAGGGGSPSFKSTKMFPAGITPMIMKPDGQNLYQFTSQ
jgi:hypothetical protein